MFWTSCVHRQEDHLYMQFFRGRFSCIYVSSLAGERICTSFHLLDCSTMFLHWGPYGQKCPFQQPSCTYLSDPSGGALQIVTCLWKFPVKECTPPPFPRFPQQSHLQRDRPLSRAFFTYLFTQRREELHFPPTEPSLSLLFCLRAVCKPNKPLDIHRKLWAMNYVFPG